MKISVIIPTYNRANFILRAITSIQEQSILVDEIIVIDDGSRDETKNLLKDQNIQYYYQENKGVAAARNLGIKKAKNPWLAFLDSDDTWNNNKIEKHIDFHLNNKDIYASYSNEKWIRNGKVISLKKYQQKAQPTFINSLDLCKIGSSSFFAHKKVFEDDLYFDESLPACEDYDLWLRILQKYTIHLINEELINKYAGHENQLSFNTKLIDIYRIFALEKHINSQYKKEVLEELLIKTTILLKGAKKHKNKVILEKYGKKLSSYEDFLNSSKL